MQLRGSRHALTVLPLILFLLAAGTAGAVAGPLSRGLEKLSEGRYEEAERELREASRADPTSARAHYALGQVLARQGKTAEAVAEFEQALRLDPQLAGLHLSLGTAHFELEDYAGARSELERAVAEDPHNGGALLLLGLTELALDRPDEAARHFERAATADPVVEQLALYNLGVTHLQAGDVSDAGAALRGSIEVAPDSSTARHAQVLLGRVESLARERKPWNVSGSLGLMYDDDVTTNEVDISTGVADGAGVVQLSGSYRLFDAAPYEVEAGYDFYQSAYFDESDFNLQSHGLSLLGSRPVGRFDSSLGYRYNLSTLGGDRFLDIHEVRQALGIAPLPRWYANASPTFRYKDFADSRRDAIQGGLALDNFLFFMDQRAYGVLGLRFESEDAQASEFDYLGFTTGTSLHLPWVYRGGAYEVDLAYRFRLKDYRSVTPSIDARRDDRIHSARLRLTRELSRSTAIRLEYEYTNSVSNLPSADYSQNIVGLKLAFSM